MPRTKAPPRIEGPYSERGGTRFRIRICDATGHRDLYFSTRQEALAGIKEAFCELPSSAQGRSLAAIIDAYVEHKVQQGACALSRTVAAALGHGSFAVTARHYAQPGAVERTRTQRLVQMLDLDAAQLGVQPSSPSAEQLLASLPSATLARLIELANQTRDQKA